MLLCILTYIWSPKTQNPWKWFTERRNCVSSQTGRSEDLRDPLVSNNKEMMAECETCDSLLQIQSCGSNGGKTQPTHTHTYTHFRSHNKSIQDLFPEAQAFPKKTSLMVKCFLLPAACVHVTVCLCTSLNKWSNLRQWGWGMKGYWKRNEARSLSPSVLSLHIKHNHHWERGEDFITLLYFLHFILPSSIHLLTHISEGFQILSGFEQLFYCQILYL